MAKKKLELLSKKQEKQLQKMVNDMLDSAADVVKEYKDLDFSELNKKQENQLQKMVNDMLDTAAEVAKEYKNLDFSELEVISGSVTQIHEDSPFLDDIFKGERWKKVVKNIPKKPKNPKDKDAS